MTSTRLTMKEEEALLLYSIQIKGKVDDSDFKRIRELGLVARTGALLKADREQPERKEWR